MGSQESPSVRSYVGLLTNEARRLQQEARGALEQGNFTRASALLGHAELLAEDVHILVGDIERREFGSLIAIADYDIRDATVPPPPAKRQLFAPPSRGMRIMIGASLVIGLAMAE